MKWILARLREPSTWAGISGLLIAVGISNEQVVAITTAGAGLAGVIAMLVGEPSAA